MTHHIIHPLDNLPDRRVRAALVLLRFIRRRGRLPFGLRIGTPLAIGLHDLRRAGLVGKVSVRAAGGLLHVTQGGWR